MTNPTDPSANPLQLASMYGFLTGVENTIRMAQLRAAQGDLERCARTIEFLHGNVSDAIVNLLDAMSAQQQDTAVTGATASLSAQSPTTSPDHPGTPAPTTTTTAATDTPAPEVRRRGRPPGFGARSKYERAAEMRAATPAAPETAASVEPGDAAPPAAEANHTSAEPATAPPTVSSETSETTETRDNPETNQQAALDNLVAEQNAVLSGLSF